MFLKTVLIALVCALGVFSYDFTVTDTKGQQIVLGDLLAEGKHVYIQWTAQY